MKEIKREKEKRQVLFYSVKYSKHIMHCLYVLKQNPRGAMMKKNLVIFLKHLCSLSRRDDM